jgi:hypothetical protein
MTRRKRLAIVSGHFPPSNLAGVHRSRLWAKHRPEFGWEPSLSPENLDPPLLKLVISELRVSRTKAIPLSR